MQAINPLPVIMTETERWISLFIVRALEPGISIHQEVALLMDLDGEEIQQIFQ